MEQYVNFLVCLQAQMFELEQTGNTPKNTILKYVRIYVALFSETSMIYYGFILLLRL
jgi:hypothetical protein